MGTEVILLDSRPAYMSAAGESVSLLTAPVGAGSLLEHVRAQLAVVEDSSETLIPNFTPPAAYREVVRGVAPDISIVAHDELDEFLVDKEPSDWLLIVDVRHYPASGIHLRDLLEPHTDFRTARRLTLLRRNERVAHERVVYDRSRHVRTIERLYDNVTSAESVGVCCSLVSVAALRRLEMPELACPALLRRQLTTAGVPEHDATQVDAIFDLAQPEGLLALNEHVLREQMRKPSSPSLLLKAPGVWVGPVCRLHESSRVYGPVILQAGVTLEPRSVVVGPSVIAAGARIKADAIVAKSILGGGVVVAEGTKTTGEVLLGDSSRLMSLVNGGECDRAVTGFLAALSAGHCMNSGADTHGKASRYARWKRVLDVCGALVGLALLAPLFFFVAVLIKLTSPGPVFFAHEREGRGGRVFRCLKFRTMVDKAHDMQRALYQQNAVDGPQFKLTHDPRITRLGAFLRITNIDELPQLLNVLRGEMSLVGPRPSPFRENQICVRWRQARLSVRPGITGLWQVCRQERGAGDFHQWIQYDVLYARHVSLMLDIRILLGTVIALGGRRSVPLHWMIPNMRQPDEIAGGVPATSFGTQREARASQRDRRVPHEMTSLDSNT